MFGKSYDGTFANGVAATGVEGLTTIVPISAISEWYDYSRSNGLRQTGGTHYPASLVEHDHANQSTATLGVAPPVEQRVVRRVPDRDERRRRRRDGNVNPFWDDRNYNNDVGERHGLGLRRPRAERRQRQDRPVRRVVGGARGAQRPAQDLALPGRATSTRSTSAARSGWTRSTAGTTTGSRASRTGSWTSRG